MSVSAAKPDRRRETAACVLRHVDAARDPDRDRHQPAERGQHQRADDRVGHAAARLAHGDGHVREEPRSAPVPLETTKNRMNASGIRAISTDSAQSATAMREMMRRRVLRAARLASLARDALSLSTGVMPRLRAGPVPLSPSTSSCLASGVCPPPLARRDSPCRRSARDGVRRPATLMPAPLPG